MQYALPLASAILPLVRQGQLVCCTHADLNSTLDSVRQTEPCQAGSLRSGHAGDRSRRRHQSAFLAAGVGAGSLAAAWATECLPGLLGFATAVASVVSV